MVASGDQFALLGPLEHLFEIDGGIQRFCWVLVGIVRLSRVEL